MIAPYNVTNSSMWTMSSDCSRFRVDDRFYYKPAAAGVNYTMFNKPANFTLDQMDDNLNYATSNG